MIRQIRHSIMASALLAAFFATSAPSAVDACSRAVYLGPENMIVTGRTMDWMEDMESNMWIFPRGLAREGGTGAASAKWTSKFGSVVVSIYEGGTADGMNEKGLVANLLYLAESKYPDTGDKRPEVALTAWTQYVLDNYATVAEAVEALRKEEIRVVPVTAPNGAKGTTHLSISDATGDSAILEYLDGKLTIHHGRQYQIMTNSPVYDQQLALAKYWEQIGGTTMLPGTNRAADRFARASFYINAAMQTADPREAVATVFSVMRNVSVPLGISTPGQPNIAATLWRTVSDHKNMVLYYESTASPGVVIVKLKEIDFGTAAGVRKLTLDGNPDVVGNQTKNFKPAEPFKWLGPDDHKPK